MTVVTRMIRATLRTKAPQASYTARPIERSDGIR